MFVVIVVAMCSILYVMRSLLIAIVQVLLNIPYFARRPKWGWWSFRALAPAMVGPAAQRIHREALVAGTLLLLLRCPLMHQNYQMHRMVVVLLSVVNMFLSINCHTAVNI